MEVNLSEIFGQSEKPSKVTGIALILQMLARLLSEKPEEEEQVDDASREIPVRPRVEPMGG
jgi:hypothetical protein